MKEALELFALAMGRAGVDPGKVEEVLGYVARDAIDRGLVRMPEARTDQIRKAMDSARIRLDFGAPKHLWKWKTAAEIAAMIGLERGKKGAMVAAAALEALGCDNVRKTNGRRVRFAPPLAPDDL